MNSIHEEQFTDTGMEYHNILYQKVWNGKEGTWWHTLQAIYRLFAGERCDMYILKKMHDTPDERNFTDESGHATKHYRTEDYNVQIGYVVKSDRMVNS
jgi:hypothetical protein